MCGYKEMRIVDFKKGDAVPEWVASINSKWVTFFFSHDVQIIKEGPWCTVYVSPCSGCAYDEDGGGKVNIVALDCVDQRPKWLKLFDRIRRKRYKADISKIKGYHYGPINYEDLSNTRSEKWTTSRN